MESPSLNRRRFLAATSALGLSAAAGFASFQPPKRKAQIAITLDLEMSREYPRRDIREWDFEKGNLDQPTKDYAVEAGRIVREAGGVLHYFCVARVLEQRDVQWLQDLKTAGHPIGNHTYDHVNVLAKKPEETQFRFQRSPWLVKGKSAEEIIRENIRLCTTAMEQRLGFKPDGFRTPGGFSNGLADRPDVQQLLVDCGFTWISGKYPAHATGKPKEEPTDEVYASIVKAQADAQPFAYPSKLIEVPMSPISDVGAFRTNYWKREWFLKAIGLGVDWAIRTGSTLDFLAHPSCLVVEDPEFETIRMICRKVKEAGDRAEIVGLDKLATRVG